MQDGKGMTEGPERRKAHTFHEMGVIDLSRPVGSGMSCYPGTPPPGSLPLCTIGEHGFNEQQLSFSSHTGTHVDLPLHLLPAGQSLDALSIERFIGPAVVLDLTEHSGTVISMAHLSPYAALVERSEFVLIRSGWGRYWGNDAYLSGYPVLSVKAARWLAGFNLKGIGVDMISVDSADSTTWPIHRVLLENNIVIIENLVIPDGLSGSQVMFFSLPLKLEGAEAAPVRAIAVPEGRVDLFCNFKR
jgi:arylformamidase